MTDERSVFPRGLEARLLALLDDEPVVIVSGPRSVGKSFTSEHVIARKRGTVLRLDDPNERRAAEADPTGYLARRQPPVLIDEYQHVPELLGAIKADLSRHGTRPGQYLLTGSVDLAGDSEWLTGRVHRARLYPLSQGELGGAPTTWFVTALLKEPLDLRGWRDDHPEHSVDYLERLSRGGYPLAVRRSPAARQRWFLDYVQDTVLRDALEHATIKKPEEMLRLLTLLAARTAQVLKSGSVGNDLGLDRHTVAGYLEVLGGLFLVERLRPWRTSRSQRLIKAPKYHVMDTGMATALLGLDLDGLRSDPSFAGHLLESFVVAEVMKQVSWLDVPPTLYHFEESGRAEVDLVFEQLDGSVVGLEIKLASHTGPRDLKGLRRLRDLAGDRWVGGLILASVPATYVVDGFVVAPVSALWAV